MVPLEEAGFLTPPGRDPALREDMGLPVFLLPGFAVLLPLAFLLLDTVFE